MNHYIKNNKYLPLSKWANEKYGIKLRPDQIKRNDKADAMQLWHVFFQQYLSENADKAHTK